jgi:hypothetical protein
LRDVDQPQVVEEFDDDNEDIEVYSRKQSMCMLQQEPHNLNSDYSASAWSN